MTGIFSESPRWKIVNQHMKYEIIISPSHVCIKHSALCTLVPLAPFILQCSSAVIKRILSALKSPSPKGDIIFFLMWDFDFFKCHDRKSCRADSTVGVFLFIYVNVKWISDLNKLHWRILLFNYRQIWFIWVRWIVSLADWWSSFFISHISETRGGGILWVPAALRWARYTQCYKH